MDFGALSPAQARALIPRFLAAFVDDPVAAEDARNAGSVVLGLASDEEIADALAAFSVCGADWGLHRVNPLVRRLSRGWMRTVIRDPEVEGTLPPGRVLLLGNHLSYVDAQVLDTLLAPEDLLVVAGPKVYEHPFRRTAAVALNTLKTPQSAHIAHNTAALSAREVAVIARRVLDQAAGWPGPLLLYPEGTRSRSGRLGPFLRAAARYTLGVDAVVPVAVWGTDQLFGMDERMRPAKVVLRLGAPIRPGPGKTEALVQAWHALAELLPPEHAPAPGTEPLAG